jgi:hypothetical protein
MAGVICVDLPEATFQKPRIHRPRQPRQRMVDVDDLIEPGAKQILFTRLPPFPWPHVVPSQIILKRENHESNLQGIPFRETVSRQTRFPQCAVSRFQIKDLGILHGRRFRRIFEFLEAACEIDFALWPTATTSKGGSNSASAAVTARYGRLNRRNVSYRMWS